MGECSSSHCSIHSAVSLKCKLLLLKKKKKKKHIIAVDTKASRVNEGSRSEQPARSVTAAGAAAGPGRPSGAVTAAARAGQGRALLR